MVVRMEINLTRHAARMILYSPYMNFQLPAALRPKGVQMQFFICRHRRHSLPL